MNKKVKKIFQSNEPYIFLIIILLGIVVQIRSGQFFLQCFWKMSNFCLEQAA